MSDKMNITLADPEEHFVVEFDSRDRRAFERVGYRALKLTGELRAAIGTIPDTYAAWLLWHAAKRHGLTGQDFDAFEARLVEFTADADTPDTNPGLGDPTGPATSAG